MGKYDDAMYLYLDNNERFADLFNVVVFQGRQVLRSDMLESDDIRYVETGAEELKTTSRYRDLKKRLKSGKWLAVVAVENQEVVDYAMPLRMMQMDSLEYAKQMRGIRQLKEEQIKAKGHHVTDWNTRFAGTDKLEPIYSICFYHGTDEWDGPRSLKDMMNFEDAGLGWENFFQDYGMNIFCANQVEDVTLFRTGLRQIVEVIPVRKDKQRLNDLFGQEDFRHLDRDTAEMIAIFTDRKELINYFAQCEEREEYDMCQAMDELEQDWYNDGFGDGIEQGIQQATTRMLKLAARLASDGKVHLISCLEEDRDLLERLLVEYKL